MITFNINLLELICMLGIPSLLTGILLRRWEKRLEKRETAQKNKDILVIKAVNASIALGEATAIAIRDQKSNGETLAALEYTKDVKHDLKNFLVEQGVENLH